MRHGKLPRLSAVARAIRWPGVMAAGLLPGLAGANPLGASVVAGQAGVSAPDSLHTQIDQSSASAVINWQQFSIGRDEYVRFQQPSASAVVLNRVIGGSASEILGHLSANGRVFLVNPQGLLFGEGAQVDVGSLLASTLEISDADFMSGRYSFTRGASGAGMVANAGSITAAAGGFAVLAGEQVSNAGLVRAQLGDVVLASGPVLGLSLDPSGLVSYALDGAARSAMAGVSNLGQIIADGGRVALSARQAQGLARTAVNNAGRISARSIEQHAGEIVLSAVGGDIFQAGTLDVSGAAGQSGGIVRALSDRDIVAGAGSEILAGGGGARSRGGDVRLVAEKQMLFERGAAIDARGDASGGVVELSGHQRARVHGDLRIGQGGRFILDPPDLVVGNGSSAAQTCSADYCEVELEGLLASGADQDISAPYGGVFFQDLVDDGVLDGQNAAHTGGTLSLFTASGGAIGFEDTSNILRLDRGLYVNADDTSVIGNVEATGGVDVTVNLGNLTIGNVSASRATLSATIGSVTTGDLRISSLTQAATLNITAFDTITIQGLVDIHGTAATVPVSEGPTDAGGATATIFTFSGGIHITGPVTLDGSVDGADIGKGSIYGAGLSVSDAIGDIVVDGLVSLTGHMGTASAGPEGNIFGAKGYFATDGGSVTLKGGVSISGHIDSATVLDTATVNGADFTAFALAGKTEIFNGVSIEGSIDTLNAAAFLTAAGSSLFLSADDTVVVHGLINAGDDLLNSGGRITNLTGDPQDAATIRGAYVGLSAKTGVSFDAVSATGMLGSIHTGLGPVSGVNFETYTENGDIVGNGAIGLTGSVGDFTGTDNFSLVGARSSHVAAFGGVTLKQQFTATGSVATGAESAVHGADSFSTLGVDVDIQSTSADTVLESGIQLTGTVGTIDGGSGFFAAGAQLSAIPFTGALTVNGAIDVSGTLNSVSGGATFTLDGANVYLSPTGGGATLGGVQVVGSIGNVAGGQGISAAANSLVITPDGDLTLNGKLFARGTVTSFTGADFSGVGGTYVSLLPFFGNGVTRELDIGGQVGTISLGGSAFAFGAQLQASSFASSEDPGGNFDFNGPVSLDGSLGAVTGADVVQLSGAGLQADTSNGYMHFNSSLSVSGHITSAAFTNSSDATGVYAYVDSFFADTAVKGAVDVTGSVGSVSGGTGITAAGSTVNLQGSFGPGEGGPSLFVGGSVHQGGQIGTFSADTETGGAYDGAVVLDARTGGIHFGEVSGDNVFIYFDSDSQIGQGVLSAAGYLEIFTPSYGPTLSGESLTVSAANMFLSANTDLAALKAGASESLTVFFAKLQATLVSLDSPGDVTLIGGDSFNPDLPSALSGGLVKISAQSIYSEAGFGIQADGLDLVAADTIFLDGPVTVGTGSSAHPGDTLLLQRLRGREPGLVPTSPAPNAYFSADTVALHDLSLSGDYLHVRANFFNLGTAHFEQPGTFVQFEPLTNLPFFAESVDVQTAGLAGVADHIRTQNGRVTSNFGRFDDFRGDHHANAERPVATADGERSAGSVDFTVKAVPNFGELILSNGLADSTLAIGGSTYRGAIQISDALAVDVRPSHTNFVFLTDSGILGIERIATNGQVVLLGGQIYTLSKDFYDLVARQIEEHFAGVNVAGPDSGGDQSDEDKDEHECEK